MNSLLGRPATVMVLLLWLPMGALQAAVTARFDRDTMHFNETVRLVIQVDGTGNNARPELDSVEEHFRILSQSSGQNISLVNGRQTATRTWTLELEPRETGSFSLDPIRVGGEESLRLRINILPEEKQAGGGDVFIEAEIEPAESYVQQQVLLTVKLHLAVPLLEGALGDPEGGDIVVQRLGDDRNYNVNREGRRYRVFERRYALFPQSSGEITIPPLRFEGRMDEGARGVFGSMMNSGRRIRATSDPIHLKVKPPAGNDPMLPWTPAKALRLVDQSDPTDSTAVGQPVTLKIQLQALGLTAEQLPDIALPEAVGLRLYPDQPVRETRVDGDDVVGIQLRRIAVIPERSGELTIPGLTVHWWNTETDTPETTTLPPRTITVAPAAGGALVGGSNTVESTSESTVSSTLDADIGANEDSARLVPTGPTPGEDAWWKTIAIASLGLWVITGLALIARVAGRRRRDRATVESETEKPGKAWRRQLEKACLENDPKAAKKALNGWTRVVGYNLELLDGPSGGAGDENLNREINRLNAALYAPGSEASEWTGAALWQAFSQHADKPDEAKEDRREALTALYPG